jgi:hypothetical protein
MEGVSDLQKVYDKGVKRLILFLLSAYFASPRLCGLEFFTAKTRGRKVGAEA